jgi:hypothetical protein
MSTGAMNSPYPNWVTDFQSAREAQLIPAGHNPKTPSGKFWSVFEPDSKVNDESDLHSEKHRPERITTAAGIQIERNDKQP